MQHPISPNFIAKTASSLGALLLLSLPWLRNRWYEIFLRLHQAISILMVYGLWIHLDSKAFLSRVYLYCLIGTIGCSSLMSLFLILNRTSVLSRGLPRTTIRCSGDAITASIKLSRPLLVQSGQWINVWFAIPTISLRSLAQSHPFVVVSWSDSPQSSMDLLIQPRQGLTQELLTYTRTGEKNCSLLFSGPHGRSIAAGDYDVVLMAASGFGIASQLPYLKQLLHGYNSRQLRTRRIHLVWEIKSLGQL
jgi:hypothetical protein